VRPSAVRPHGALRDLAGQLHHAPPERGEHDRRQPADLRRRRGHLPDELPDVVEGFTHLEAEPIVYGPVTHADPEPEPRARQLVDHRGGLRVVERVTRVDVRDAGPERDLTRREGQGLTEGQPVARARAIEPGEALALEPLRHLERRAPAPGHRDESDRRFRDHLREYKRSGHACHRAAASLSSPHPTGGAP
jgi:hypothetical protein